MLRTSLSLISTRNIILVALTLFASHRFAAAVSTGSTNAILIVAVLPMGIFFIIKPFWGLTAASILDLWFSCIRISMLSPRTYVISFLFGIVIVNILFYKKNLMLNKNVKIILLISTFLFMWIIYRNLATAAFDSRRLFGTIAHTLNPLLIGILTLSLINNIKALTTFIHLIAVAASVSAFFGIMQFFNVEIFWEIRSHLGPIIDYERIPGLAFFGINLSYQLGSIIPLMVGVYLSPETYIKRKKPLILVLIFIMSSGLLVTLSRSGILGCLIGVLTVLLISPRYRLSRLLFFALVATLAIYSISSMSERIFDAESSALSRIPLAITAIKIARDHPLGVGRGQWEEQAEEYISEIRHLPFHQVVLVTSSHNQFLNILVYWGFPGLILVIMFYRQIFKGITFVRNTTNNPLFQTISAGLLGSFISYIINSMFHNAGPFLGDPFNWYLIGISFILMNFEYRSKNGAFNVES